MPKQNQQGCISSFGRIIIELCTYIVYDNSLIKISFSVFFSSQSFLLLFFHIKGYRFNSDNDINST